MTQDIEQYRAGFEAWARDKWPGLPLDGEHIKGGIWLYYDDIARDWWQVWTAAKREASTEPSAQVGRAALDEFCDKYCHHKPELVSVAESAFYWFNKCLAGGAQKDEATDAARYHWLIAQLGGSLSIDLDCGRTEIDETIDAAIAHTKAQEGARTPALETMDHDQLGKLGRQLENGK